MTVSSRKTLWWSVLAMTLFPSIAYSLLFIYTVAMKGYNMGSGAVYWTPSLILSLALTILARFKLRAIYREDSTPSAGHWHLSIADFYATLLFTGTLLGVFRAWWPRDFADGFAILGVVLGVAFLGTTFVAARIGFTSPHLRWLYAFGLLIRILGLIYLGQFLISVFAGVVIGLWSGFGFRILLLYLSEFNVFDLRTWSTYPVPRILLLCTPLGTLLCRLATAQFTKRPAPSPYAT